MSHQLLRDSTGPSFFCEDCHVPHSLGDMRLIIGDGRTKQRCPACHEIAVHDIYGGDVQPITIHELEADAKAINASRETPCST